MNPRWDEKQKRWECSVGSGKTRKWFRTKVTGEEGKQLCLRKRDMYQDGPAPLKPGSLAEFIESVWWPRTKAKTTYATQVSYRSILNTHISQFYGWQIDDIRLEILQPWVSNMKGEPKRIKNICLVMKSILELARLTDRYHRNDHKLMVTPSISNRQMERPYLTEDNMLALLRASQGTIVEGPIYAGIMLGLRRSEVCGLKHGQTKFDAESATVNVSDNRQYHGETKKLKSKPEGFVKRITVPLEVGHKLESYGNEAQLYLFLNKQGLPIHPNAITRAMPGICKVAGTPKILFKELRTACRAMLEENGTSAVDILDILGHSSMSTSLIYQPRRPQAQAGAIGKLMSRGNTAKTDNG